MHNKEIKVSIECMTYNHASYIEDAMNGFCMQQTMFPFVAVIVDDASTDGEPAVIKSYLNDHFDMQHACTWETDDAHFIEAQHKENENCTFAVVLLKYNFWQAKKDKAPLIAEWMDSAKYIALCDGDDYWTKPNKLQLQVGYLDSHLEIGMVYTDYDQFYHCEGKMVYSMIGSGRKPKIVDFETHLRSKGYIAPMSWVYRKEFLNITRNYKGNFSIDGTFIFALEVFLHSKIQYLDCVTCVYRISPGSVTNKTSPDDIFRYERGLHETQLYYVKKYPVSKETVNSLDWFYEHHACYIVLNGIRDEIVNARHYLRNHINKQESLKHQLFVICMLYPFATKLYKHWKKLRQLIGKTKKTKEEGTEMI